ncbi:unannotated protein [freshwater metagenome]|uniref:Unannotated protein n=1 Tax=freshwater metagenome TaxID=449393 RepID=A0A6J6HQ05_9ZZZZ|nr:hypothetical protein [Actinomycetota bacterium]
MTDTTTVAGLYSRCLRAAGVVRAFAAPGHGLPRPDGIRIIDVASAELAVLLADADGRLSVAPDARPGLALLPGPRIRLGSQPGEVCDPWELDEIDALPAAIAGWSFGQVHASVEIELLLDFDAPVRADLEPITFNPGDQLMRLSPSLAPFDTFIVVGPGVVRDGQAAGVLEAAERIGAGVVCTPGAFGVMPIDHPLWRGVVGLQADDAGLAGLSGAELVIIAGIDSAEIGSVIPVDAQVLEVEPWHLGLMAHHWPEPDSGQDHPVGSALVDALATLAGKGRNNDSVPLHPVRAVMDVIEVLGPEAMVAVDPGPAALWMGRGLVAAPAGQLVIPGLPVKGFAVAAALVAGLDGRPALAIATAPTDPCTDELLDLAAGLDVAIVLEVWGAEAAWEQSSDHRAGLVGAMREGGISVLAAPVDFGTTAELLDIAGPVDAWMPTTDEGVIGFGGIAD